jgi:hypothetical protein
MVDTIEMVITTIEDTDIDMDTIIIVDTDTIIDGIIKT